MTKKMSSVNRPLGYYELDPKFPWTIVSGKCATKLVLYRKLRFSFISAARSFNYFFVAIIGYPGVFSERRMLPRVTKPMLNYLCTLNVQTANFHFFFPVQSSPCIILSFPLSFSFLECDGEFKSKRVNE